MPGNGLIYHFSHHVIAQVGGQIAQPDLAASSARGQRQLGGICLLVQLVVALIQGKQTLWGNVKKQKQIQHFLQPVECIGGIEERIFIAQQVVQIRLLLFDFTQILAGLQAIHREHDGGRRVAPELFKIFQPRIDFAGIEQHIAQMVIGRRMIRLNTQDLLVAGSSAFGLALLLEQYAEVE